jgi:hypothetical protein
MQQKMISVAYAFVLGLISLCLGRLCLRTLRSRSRRLIFSGHRGNWHKRTGIMYSRKMSRWVGHERISRMNVHLWRTGTPTSIQP